VDIEIDVLGITPSAGVSGESEASTEQKLDAGLAHRYNSSPVNGPFPGRNRIGPAELKGRG